MSVRVALAKWAMRLWPATPILSPSGIDDLEYRYAEAIRIYKEEVAHPVDEYFGCFLKPWLHGTRLLDLGCGTGGRTIAWSQRYAVKSMDGLDPFEHCLEAGRRLAKELGVNVTFTRGIAEYMPYPDQAFDAILSFDALEHVRSIRFTLGECWRVLRPGGILAVVFPGWYHPTEHHLSMVTRTPFLHLFFSGETLFQAFEDLIQTHGPVAAAWFLRVEPLRKLQRWERGLGLNGVTQRSFRRTIRAMGWEVELFHALPLLKVGAAARRLGWVRHLTQPPLMLLARLPLFEEVFTHRIVYILRRPAGDPLDGIPVLPAEFRIDGLSADKNRNIQHPIPPGGPLGNKGTTFPPLTGSSF